jgi:hypothetical protein
MKDFKWVIHSNQIKDCPLMIQYIDIAMKIWGKNITTLKGKTTWSKIHPVVRDFVKVPKELLKLHKEVFLTTDIFFVNKIRVMPGHSAQSPVPKNPQAHDDPYCTQCRQAVDFFPDKGGSVRHSESEDHHVWRDSRLQEAAESPDWTVLLSTRVK